MSAPAGPAFFVSLAGKRILYCNAHIGWKELVARSGLKPRSNNCRPRPHDLRHSFAVRTLLSWYRDGADVQALLPVLATFLGHVHPRDSYWYLTASPELLELVAARLDTRFTDAMSLLAPPCRPSSPTGSWPSDGSVPTRWPRIATPSRLLLGFAQQRTGKPPSGLALEDLDAALIGAFLVHLEDVRRNSVRTRNARLAAIHSLFSYAAVEHPEHAHTIQRVLAMPPKRFDRRVVSFLTRPEIDAVLAAPDLTTWLGRRDRALLLVAMQTGMRVSELTGLTCGDVVLGSGGHLRCHGKGRKERITPLTKACREVLCAWTKERQGDPADPLFPTRQGGRLSRDAVALLVAKHAHMAAESCPSLRTKTVTPHVLRHTAAMEMRAAGIDDSLIALVLGHETIETTQIYKHADLAIKERALARTAPANAKPGRYQPPDSLLAFLEDLRIMPSASPRSLKPCWRSHARSA